MHSVTQIFALTICAAILTACQPASQPLRQPTVTSAQFENFANSVVSNLNTLDAKITAAEIQQSHDKYLSRMSQVAKLDPTAKGYAILETDVGKLLVADTEATPYLDGFSVRFKVGNPLAANIETSTIIARWGPPPPEGDSPNLSAAVAAYDKGQRTNLFEISQPLLSGTWTPVEIKVTPADAASVKRLSIELRPKAIYLRPLK